MSALSSRALWLVLAAGVAVPLGAVAEGLAGDISAISAGGPLTQPGSLLGGAQLRAEKGSSAATVKLSRTQSISESNGQALFDTWSVTASAPLNKTGDDTTLASLDGLANSASVELGFARFWATGKKTVKAVLSKLPGLDAICRRVFEARKAKDGTPVPDKIDGCDSELVHKHGSADDIHAFDSTYWDLGNSYRWLFGGNAKGGYQNFEFVSAGEPAKQKQNKAPWSVGLWGAVQPGDVPWLLTLGAQYQRTYKEGDPSAVCPVPAPGQSTVTCLTGPLDAPKQIARKLVSLELRGRPGDVGFSLAATRDFEAKVTGVDLPVYFIVNSDNKLTAGLRVGWRSDKKGSAGVFVGVPFGLYK